MQLRSVNLGGIVTWDGCDWIVDAHGARGARLNPVAGGSPVWVDLATISQEESFENHHADTEHARAARNRVELAMLASEVRQDVLFWLQHVNEVQYGLIDPHDPDAQPRDGYGPETTLEERVQRKLAELGAAGIKTSRPSLFRKVAKYRTEGIAGLVDRRLLRRQEPRRIAPEIKEAAQRVIADHLGATSRDVLYFIDKVKHSVRQNNPGKDVNWPSDRTIRRWLTPMLEAAGLTKTASHRRSESNRPNRAFQPILAFYPGQYVEIDSNTLDVETAMPDGKIIRPYMTAAVDVYSGSVAGFHIHAGAPSSTDHTVLFARIAAPRRAIDRMNPALWLSNSKTLPSSEMIAMGQATGDAPAMPFISIETLTMDRGKDFLASRVAAEMLGWSVVDAPPHSPTAKPHVERFFKSMNSLFLSRLDAYVGNSPDHRGRNQRAPIPFTQLVDGMWSFIVTVYQNRPHKGLVLREYPGRTFTPNQMYSATFDASAGIPIPISQSDYISLMPRHDRTFQSDGIHLSNEIYDSPDLNEVRGRPGKHEIRQDPYDTERIWVCHPDSGEWITCFARSIRLAALPFGTSTTASLSATAQADDPHTQWAQDFLDAESHRVKATRSGTDKGTQKTSSGKAAQKKATKSAAERANRKRDPLPRPAAVEPMQLPTAVPVREHPDDYTVA